jgi:ketosteroid isomerase-like protein
VAIPAGIFRGRDEVRKTLEAAFKAGVHGLTVAVEDMKASGNVAWYAAQWKAKIGDQEPGG